MTADDQQKTAGAANPPLTHSFSGFVLNDTAAVVSGAAALSTTADANSTAGTYPITISQGTLSAANYQFTFVDGTLTVTQASVFLCDPGLSLPAGTIHTFAGSGAVGAVAGGFGPGTTRTTAAVPPKTPTEPQIDPSTGLGITA